MIHAVIRHDGITDTRVIYEQHIYIITQKQEIQCIVL